MLPSRRLLTTLFVALTLSLTGCDNIGFPAVRPTPPTPPVPTPTPPTPPAPVAQGRFVYVGNQGGSLSGYSLNANTGALIPLPGFPSPAGVNPTALTHDPGNHFIIVADIAQDELIAFSINSTTGALTPLPGSPSYSGVKEPVALTFDPSGTHLYVDSMGGGAVAAFNLSAIGSLTTVSGQPFATGNPTGVSVGSQSILIDHAGTFLYVIDLSSVYVFAISPATGALTRVQTVAGPSSGSGLAIDPADAYLYAVGSGNNSIQTYAVQPGTGLLSLFTQSPMLEKDGAYTITLAPGGLHAFTIENNNDVVAYTLANGIFNPVGPTFRGVYGEQIALDPSGNFLYVPQACSFCSSDPYNIINSFTVASNGALTRQPGASPTAGMTPWGITITTY